MAGVDTESGHPTPQLRRVVGAIISAGSLVLLSRHRRRKILKTVQFRRRWRCVCDGPRTYVFEFIPTLVGYVPRRKRERSVMRMDCTAAELFGAKVHSVDGRTVGTVGQVYLDTHTREPLWVTVKTGIFGAHESFVPLHDATLADGIVRVPLDRELVKDAPRIDADEILPAHQHAILYHYYRPHTANLLLEHSAEPALTQAPRPTTTPPTRAGASNHHHLDPPPDPSPVSPSRPLTATSESPASNGSDPLDTANPSMNRGQSHRSGQNAAQENKKGAPGSARPDSSDRPHG